MSVCGGVQPDLLPALQAEAGARDGFLKRMLFAYPETHPMRLVDAELDDTLIAELVFRLQLLRDTAPEGVVALSAEAFRLFQTWHEENRTAQERVSGLIQGTYAKLPSQDGRLALVLHCLAHPNHPARVPLAAETMGRRWNWRSITGRTPTSASRRRCRTRLPCGCWPRSIGSAKSRPPARPSCTGRLAAAETARRK